MASSTKWMVPLIKVFTCLFIVPFTFTFLYLRHEIHSNKICFVGPSLESFIMGKKNTHSNANMNMGLTPTDQETGDDDDSLLLKVDELYGIYRNVAPFQYRRIGSTREDYKDGWIWNIIHQYGYPSLLSLTADLNIYSSSSSRRWRPQSQSQSQNLMIEFDENQNALWSFVAYGAKQKRLYFPDDGFGRILEDGRYRYPPSGDPLYLYPIPKPEKYVHEAVSVSCPAYAYAAPSNKSTKRKNPTLQYIQECPASSLLIAINVLLAFAYWNNRVDPSTVCVEYQKILYEHELWRSFTGALAHFEPLHIGFNMMSLYALGMEIEPSYGTMPFLFCNICLIPLTTMVEMGMIWLRIRWTGNEQLKQRKSVGYSGVLFALMVVSSLERTRTCPIPFAADLCFKTYSKFGLKFNVGPMVQLLVAQVIMPRASFMGHLAGIICGFTLHWNLLPKDFFYMPQTLIPAILLCHLRYVRRIITFSYEGVMGTDTSTVEMVDRNDPSSVRGASSSRKSEVRERTFQLRRWMRNGMIFLTLMSMRFFNVFGSIVWGQIFVTICIVFAVRGENRDVAVIWRVAIVTIIIVMITDAMHIPYWIKMRHHIEGKWAVRNILVMTIFIIARYMGNFAALVLASEALMESGDCGGIFDYIFGLIVRSCYMIARAKLNAGTTSGTWEAFQGQGTVLGRV